MKRFKEDVQKKEQELCEVQERERRLKTQCENVSRDLKHEKEEVIYRSICSGGWHKSRLYVEYKLII